VSTFPPPPKASAWLAEARFAREGGKRTREVRLTSLRQGSGGPPTSLRKATAVRRSFSEGGSADVIAGARESGSRALRTGI
jgi:hypothetical protein